MDKVVVWILLLYYWSVSLLVSSWITGVALHKLRRSDGRTDGDGRQEVGVGWQSENVMYVVCGNLVSKFYLAVHRVE